MSKKAPKRLNIKQIARIEDMYQEGVIPYRIAKFLGIPPGVVRYHINRIKKSYTPKLEDFVDLPIPEKDIAAKASERLIDDLLARNKQLKNALMLHITDTY